MENCLLRAVRADLPNEHKSLELVVFSDWHYSDPNSAHDLIQRDIDYVLSHDNAYCVLAGDLLNCAIRTGVSDVYSDLSPMVELNALTDMLKPVVAKGKIIGVVDGNHEARHYKTNGVDMTRLLCRSLGVESKYEPDALVIFLRFGRDVSGASRHRPVLYTVFLTHGFGGGRKEGGKLQRLADCAEIIDCDAYIVGHTHLPAAMKVDFARTSPANSSITYAPHLFLNCAAKLRYGGYGCRGGFKPANTDTPKIIFDGTTKHMEAVI